MAEVLDVIFQTLDVEEVPEDAESEERAENGEVDPVHARVRQKVHRRLLDLCARTSVTERLWELASVLWSAPTPDWYTWVESRFRATLGAAILEGCQRICPQFDADSLVLDIDPGPPPPNDSVSRFGIGTDGYEIWVTENSPGGAGVIEEILRRVAEDPMHFFRLVESALAPSDFELVDREISRLLNSLDNDEQLRQGFSDFRDAVGNNQTHAALAALRALLRRQGYRISHSVMTAINSRLLRPGSDTDTDRILRDLINDWKEAEERLGVEIDARVFAYVAARQPRFEDALSHIHADFRSDPQWNFQAIYGLLWPRGNVVRKLPLSARNPYASIPSADRQLLRDCLEDTTTTVSVTEPNWRDRLATLLEERGVARLGAPVGLRDNLKMALLSIVSEPLDVGFLSVYPIVERIESQSDLLEALLATKLLVLGNNRAFETAILVSGDKDYLETVKAVKSMGMRVEVVSWKRSLSQELAQESSRNAILLDDLRAEIEKPLDEVLGSIEYNYANAAELVKARKLWSNKGELPGLSVFLREGGDVFHTYSVYQRGLDLFLNTYNFLDVTPLGRQEGEDKTQSWIRHHDNYPA